MSNFPSMSRNAGCGVQVGRRYGHGQTRCLQNVHSVDFEGIDDADTNGIRVAVDMNIQPFPLAVRELFGIGNALNIKTRRQHNGRRHNRAGQGAPAGLVNTSNMGVPFLGQRLFKRPEIHFHSQCAVGLYG